VLEGAVIGAAVVVWRFALALHRRRTDRRVRTLHELIGHRVTLGVAIRGSGRFIIPVIARIASVDKAHERLFVEVIGVDLTADSNYCAQAPDSYLFEIAENGIPLGFVRSIEVDEARLRW
jgi:hypothetical protein